MEDLSATWRRGLNGKEQDEISGLFYYGFRYYDPLLLRWTSMDPFLRFAPDVDLSTPQRLNVYAFSGNNPVRFVDRDGMDWKETIAGIAVGAVNAVSFGTYSKYVLPRLMDSPQGHEIPASEHYEGGKFAGEAGQVR